MTTNEDFNDSLSTSILNGDGMGTPTQKKKMRRSWFETPPPTKLEIAIEKKKRRSSGTTRRKSDEEVETLILTHFTSAPRIGFGNIKVGKAKSRILMVRNPHEYEQEVIVERFPYKKSFSIDSTKFTVQPDDYKTISITWSPDEACSCREMILFKVDGVYRLQAYVFGIAEEIKQKKTTKRKKGLLGIKVKKPFSIISTPGLACIRDNYSPLDAEKPRMSNIKQHPVIGEKYELLDKHSTENTPPPLESTAISVSSVGFTNSDDRVPELGCSPTFSPILKTSEVDGSCVVTESCYSDTQFSALREVDYDSTNEITKRIAELEDKSSKLSDKDTLIDTPKNRKSQNSRNSSRNKSTENDNKENSPLKRPRTKSAPDIIRSAEKKFLSPETFLNDSLNLDTVKVPVKQHPVFACIHENQTVSPNSFLEDMNHSHGDSSLKGEVPSPSKVLQDTIPHNLIVEQLKNVQTSLHEQSFDKLLSHTQKQSIQKISSGKAPVSNLSKPALEKGGETRKTTFLKQKQVKKTEKVVKKQVEYQSPRRTTFLVSLKKNRTSVKKEELTKSCKKTETISKEEKPKRRKLLGSNKVGQTPVSKQSQTRTEVEEVTSIDSVAITRTKEVVEEVTIQSQTQQVYQIFTGTVTKEKPSPQLQDSKKTHGKRLFDSNSPKKSTSPLARTVTKEKPSLQVHQKVIGKKLFEDKGSTVTPQRMSPFIDEFGSPSILPSSPSEVTTRRTTLTVTKQRPSDALLHATQTVFNNNVFECTPTGKESSGDSTDNCMVIEMKKSPSLLKVEDPTKSLFTQAPVSPVLLGSPSKLPTSPNPDMSRRSTHLVASPKFVDLTSVSPKRLFPPLDDVLEPVSEEKDKTEIADEMIENQENIPPAVDQSSIPNESTMSLKSLGDMSKDISDISIESEASIKSTKSSERPKSSQKDTSPRKPLKSGSNRQSFRERKPSGSRSGGKKDSVVNNNTASSTSVFTVTLSPTSSKTKTKPPVPTPVKRTTKPVNSGTVTKPPPSRRQSLAPATSREKLDTVGKSSTDRRRSANPVGPRVPSSEKKFEPVASLTRSTNNRNTPRDNLKSSTNLDKSTIKSKTSTAPVIKKSLSSSVNSITKKPRGPVKGLTQSKLMLIKKPKTAVPKHPMPFAARNMYYDERWLEKQERGFSHWLNFILTPPEEYNNNVEKTKVDAGSIFVEGMKGSGNTRLAPTKEVLSIRAYTARRRMNRLRRASCQLYQSESVIHVIRKVEIEVESRRLAVRKDRMLHADLGIKQSILDMLLCYNPLWLRIGLETIFGEMILLQSNNDVIGLSRFILYRLLSNPDIAAEYAHPTVPHLYRDGFAEATSSHTLKKFLLLVYFLDQAKQSRLIDHDPCLFCKNADIKASKNLLVQFSRDFLSGEGDITKHLGYLGYIVSHVQTPLDEFDYAVSALGVDLRDGLRLTRVMEYLTNNWTLMSSLRSPAISRLQKIHNVDVVFKVLAERGLDVSQLDMKLNARDIVDGHREKTLNLLWHIIFHFQVDVLIDIEQLKAEIVILEKTLRVKVSMQKLLKSSADNQARRDSGDTDVLKNERLTLLLKWCRLVCLHYGIKVENFTVSFSDGRALCYLIHHYYPALLPATLINNQTTVMYMEEMEKKEEEEFDEDASFDWSQTPHSDLENPEMFEQLLNNERENFKLLYEKVSGLGGIPLMLKAADMSNTIPDEKIVMTYVSHLCGRLLDIRAESRAARVIQIAWRKYWLRHAVQHQQKMNNAARVIQIAYRQYCRNKLEEKQTYTAIKLQALWRGYKARKRTAILRNLKLNYKMSEAALTIQRALQSNVQRKRYLRMKASAVKIQSVIKGYLIRKQIQKQDKAAKTIQSYYHGYKQTLEFRQRYLTIKSACIIIQRNIKCWLKRKEDERLKSVTIIQKYVRGFLQRLSFHRQLYCIIKIQTNYRRHRKQTKFLAMKYAALTIQRYYRQYRQECLMKAEQQKEEEACILLQHWWCEQRKLTLQKQNDAVSKIQAGVRGLLCRKQLKRQNQAAVKLQSIFKMKMAYKKFLRQKAAAIVLSHHFKSYLVRKHQEQELKLQTNSAIKIQSQWRSFSQQRQFNKMKQAIVKIQSFIRKQRAVNTYQTKRQAAILIQQRYRAVKMCRAIQKEKETYKTSAISIQAAFKTYMAVKTFQRQKQAAIKIQNYVRMVRCRNEFIKKKKAVEIIQVKIRAHQLMKQAQSEFQLKKQSCIQLQSYYRGHMTRKQVHKMHISATKIQAMFRCYVAKHRFQTLCQAAKTLQACYRNNRITKQCQQHFQKQKSSAIHIQRCFRLYLEKKNLDLRNDSAVIIQSAFRTYMTKKSYQKIYSTTIFLQRLYRSSQTTKTIRTHYVQKKHCTVVIQKVFRGYLARQSYLKQRDAAITIQSSFRKWKHHHEYQRLKSVVVNIQRVYRNIRLSKCQRQSFLCTKQATIRLQACYRGYQQRKTYQNTLSSIVTIQKWWRKTRLQQQYNKLKSTVNFLQRIYRNNLVAKKQRILYVTQKHAAITIQTAFKSHKIHCHYQQMRQSAVKIQAWWRCISSYNKYLHNRQAIINLQRRFRRQREMTQEVSKLACKKAAILKIQTAYRAYTVRQLYSLKYTAAVRIQSTWRRFIAHRQFQRLKSSVVICQRTFRNNSLSKICRTEYLQTQKAAICLQSLYKAKVTRQWYIGQRSAAITIQSWWRTVLAVQLFKKKQKAASTIQVFYRKYMEHKLEVKIQEKKEKSACQIQRFWRHYHDNQVKKQNMAAVKIQAVVRSYLLQKQFKKQQASAICIQNVYRAYKARKQYENMCRSVVIIQKRWRASLQARRIRRRYLMTYGAIITIQAMIRGFLTRKKMEGRNMKCILIQSYMRGYLARLHYLKLKAAAIVLQNIFRSSRLTIQARAEYLQKKMAVLQIQKWYRMCRLARTRQQISAAIKIQSWYRCVKQRQLYVENRKKIIHVQSCVRRFLSQKHSRQILSAILTIQRNVRVYLFIKKFKCAIEKRHKSALLIQKTLKKCVWLRTERKHKAAVKIQSVVRTYLQRKVYKNTINCVTIIQSRIRSYIVRKQYYNILHQHRAARIIQSAYRNHILHQKHKAEIERRRDYVMKFSVNVKYHLSAIVIQRLYRKHLILKTAQQHLPSIIYIQRKFKAIRERRQFIRVRSIVCHLQYNIRHWLKQRHSAATVIQRAVKLWLIKHRLRKQHRTISRIQAIWKGYALRKKTHTKKLAEMRCRINKANESACEENKLGNRTTSALDYLLRYKQMSYVLEAVTHLEVATRLSPRCCERLVEVNAVSVIFTLMRSCNRSLPHMEAINYLISILLNLAKYEKTIDYVYNVEDSISRLLDLMTIFREKGHIFTKTATLLGILALDPDRKQAIVSDRNHTDKIISMYALTARKHKLEEGRNKVKAKIAASKTFNSTLPLSTPAKKRRIRPDWILNRDSIHEIENPMRAIKFVMDNLGLVPK